MNGRLLFVFVFVALCGSSSIGRQTLSVSAQQITVPGTGQSTSKEEKRGPDPVVDLRGSEQADSTKPDIRAKRNHKHDVPAGHPFQEPDPGEEDYDLGGINDAHSTLPALPVKQSDAIVIGTVAGARAYLSADAHNVYSEFKIAVDTILMDSTGTSLKPGDVVDVDRDGGAVRFPSGKVLHFRTYQQGFPKVSGRYLVFLKYQPDIESFDLVTGYHLSNSKVKPLDGVGFSENPGSRLAFSKYEDANGEDLMNDVRKAIVDATK